MSEPCDHLWEAANLAAVVQEQDERIDRLKAEVASLTAIRERAEEVERQPALAGMVHYNVVRRTARFILGAASGSDCTPNPSPEPPPEEQT